MRTASARNTRVPFGPRVIVGRCRPGSTAGQRGRKQRSRRDRWRAAANGDAAMTARVFPDEPRFASASEEIFVRTLQEQLPDDAVLFCNLRFSDRAEDREADLIVAWPGVGVAVVEVKGGSVSLDRGVWRQVGTAWTGRSTRSTRPWPASTCSATTSPSIPVGPPAVRV